MDLAVSFLITWGVGLAPALLIRYIFCRRPISRRAANWIAAGSCLTFRFLFAMLLAAVGQKPGTGAVWVLMFFFSRWIMTDHVPFVKDDGLLRRP